jgi:hypothetical protein
MTPFLNPKYALFLSKSAFAVMVRKNNPVEYDWIATRL